MAKSAREKLLEILEALRDRIASPSDVISTTGLPRYEVLAAFHVLEALNIIEVVYSRGNYKLYRLTSNGEKLLNALKNGLRVFIATESDARHVMEPTKIAVENGEELEVAT